MTVTNIIFWHVDTIMVNICKNSSDVNGFLSFQVILKSTLRQCSATTGKKLNFEKMKKKCDKMLDDIGLNTHNMHPMTGKKYFQNSA